MYMSCEWNSVGTLDVHIEVNNMSVSVLVLALPWLDPYWFSPVTELHFFYALPCSIKHFHMWIIQNWKQELIKDRVDKVWQRENELAGNPTLVLWDVWDEAEEKRPTSKVLYSVYSMFHAYFSKQVLFIITWIAFFKTSLSYAESCHVSWMESVHLNTRDLWSL